MNYFPLKKGFIHLGIIAVLIVGLAVFASVKIFADRSSPQRFLENVSPVLCQVRPNNPACKDSDNDGWSDSTERYLGTNPNSSCGENAWPPDINNDRAITQADVDLFKKDNLFNSKAGDPNFNRRFDLNMDMKITLSDVLGFNRYLGQTCVPASPSKINWNTPYASLEADTMEIIVGRKRFSGQGKITSLHSDPGSATYQTLEIEWTENNTPMRLFIYFSADGQRWKVTELRTYNGSNPGDWIIYPGFDGNSLGQPLRKEDFELKGDSGSGGLVKINGAIRFKNIKLQAFKTPQPTILPISPFIKSITPANVGPYSGDIRIVGSGFGTKEGIVHFTLNGNNVGGIRLKSWNDTTINACDISVPSPDKFYDVKVQTNDGQLSQGYSYYVGPSASISTPLPCPQ